MAHLGTRKLTLTIDGSDVSPDVSTAEITAAATDSDFVSFASAGSGGGRQYKLHLVFAQDMAASSLWDQVWSHAGEDIDVVVRPYGNAVASATQPHFTGTVTVVEPDGTLIGGDADPSTTAVFTTDVEWTFTAKPTRVTS